MTKRAKTLTPADHQLAQLAPKSTGIPVHVVQTYAGRAHQATTLCGIGFATQTIADHLHPDACPKCLEKLRGWKTKLEYPLGWAGALA